MKPPLHSQKRLIGARFATIGALVASAVLAPAANAAHPKFEQPGPSSSDTPYLAAVRSGVDFRSILTVGDSVGGYKLVGVPDGLGIIGNSNGTFTLLVNHELTNVEGGPNAHAALGAFVSQWTVRTSDLTVLSGGDLIQAIATWNSGTDTYDAPAYGVVLSRLCSADLPLRSAIYDGGSSLGFKGRILLHGEEIAEGRAFASVARGTDAGTSFELPALGKFAHENVVANPATGSRTVVMGMDDTSPSGQVYVYVGDKQSTGNPAEKAGLTNGDLFGIKVAGVAVEDRAAGIGGPSRPFTLAPLGDVTDMSGAALETASDTAGATEFLRPEDGSWDPTNYNRFYFVTTDRFNTVKQPGVSPTLNTPAAQEGATRLWRLDFQDRTQPELGGTITKILDGSTGQGKFQMMDNVTVDWKGRVVIQEDAGNQPYLGSVLRYDPSTDKTVKLAEHDVDRFGNDRGKLPVAPFTSDEESSGVIDASKVLGKGWYVMDVQAHYHPADTTLVEGGQLLLMYAP